MATRGAVRRTITIDRPPEEVVAAWRRPEVLPQLVSHVAAVEREGDGRARWCISRRPLPDLAWTTEVVEATPTSLRWQGDDPARTTGELVAREAPHELGSEVTIQLEPTGGGPLGTVVGAVTRWLAPTALGVVLHRLKALLETGELPTLEGSPSARSSDDAAGAG